MKKSLYILTLCSGQTLFSFKVVQILKVHFAFRYFFQPYKFHKLEENVLPNSAILTKKEALKYYQEMVTIRRMEQEASKLYKEKIIRGFCHLYSGQVCESSFSLFV